uniref:Uncharacterized protein n=1 Tax=Arundo donax TaxID=35708 RepID=A0A0A9CGY8_ARUDO
MLKGVKCTSSFFSENVPLNHGSNHDH